MDFDENYEIDRTADFIFSRNFTRVALQFPDELLKHSVRVVSKLKDKLQALRESSTEENAIRKEVGLFVMADATYGSCCVDEVGASHIDADCVIHYGHTCLSPTSTVPAFFVFGKASLNISSCTKVISDYSLTSSKPIVVLFGLEYAHSIPHIRKELMKAASVQSRPKHLEFHFADVMSSVVNPYDNKKNSDALPTSVDDGTPKNDHAGSGSRHRIGGLILDLPTGCRLEDFLLLWVGSNNSAFSNVVLTFNSCEIVRYDADEDRLVTDLSESRRILKRRYYLVEKAKDANVVGILVGTLGVAGYLDVIHQMKDLVTSAGKKAYTLVMGRPNPAKLANFPECDIFIFVSCAQTALLDSKEFLAPVITPFEAILAFSRGSQWTGAYIMEFQDLIFPNTSPLEARKSEEPRFSFLQGGYVEDFDLQENIEEDNEALALVNATEKALQLHDRNSTSIVKGTVKSGLDYFANRSYQGLEMRDSTPEPFVIGKSGKASGYEHENNKLDDM
ncbi:uncharacterized protein [Euphorbia lathyris]|uniref:uncharacterized protein n=1 Tax=Euphorbia lathyris TaxID=212925 RepID=UPI00331401F1